MKGVNRNENFRKQYKLYNRKLQYPKQLSIQWVSQKTRHSQKITGELTTKSEEIVETDKQIEIRAKIYEQNMKPVSPCQTLCHDEQQRALGKSDHDRGEDTEAPQKQSRQHPKLKA